ncbi:MAG: patatin-like phospholipase family protein [Phycisphaerales bacterium]|nr:patatin-like phospholipase family protein [Phycisphaerales bacterium]
MNKKHTNRRTFLKAGATGAAGLTLASSTAMALSTSEKAATSSETLQQEANQISLELFKNDGLARPIPSKPTPCELAEGVDRSLVLGGGGVWYIAWYIAFFQGLEEAGLDMNELSEMVVGTSAGAYMGSAMRCGNMTHMLKTMEFYAKNPDQFGKIAPFTDPNISQQRAMKVSAAAKNGTTETIQTIGRSALAAHNKADSDGAERFAIALTADSTKDWPAENLYTSSNDCYTGERLIVSKEAAQKNKIPLARATGASSSLPGVMGPTVLGERYAMDGGICSNACHTDIVAGSKRAVVISLTNGLVPPVLTGVPHPIGQNIKDLQATGTQTMWIIANPPDINLLDPKNIGSGLESGKKRARTEAKKIESFWA